MSNNHVEEIHSEAERVDRLIKKTTERLKSSDCDPQQSLHLELCRAEQQAYLAGLLYAVGHPTMLDRLAIVLDLAADSALNEDPSGNPR